jgi:hypothetical protein
MIETHLFYNKNTKTNDKESDNNNEGYSPLDKRRGGAIDKKNCE